jgi:aspartyl-tRNA(Asn)/glutamyl-tRNA(Gln) amidotransferase subunit B
VSDQGAIEIIIDSVLAAQPEAVAKYQAGKVEIVGFLVGQIMREAKGKANPGIVNEILQKKLKGE